LTHFRNRARLRRAHTPNSSPPAAGHSHLTNLTNRARLRRAHTPNSSPPAAGHSDLTNLRNRARLRRAHTPNSSPPAARHCHLTNLTNRARLRRAHTPTFVLQQVFSCGGEDKKYAAATRYALRRQVMPAAFDESARDVCRPALPLLFPLSNPKPHTRCPLEKWSLGELGEGAGVVDLQRC
jgi:hypothetical protein